MAALSRILVACSLAVFAKFATAQQSDVSGADGDVSAQHDGHDHGDVHEELVLPHGIVMLISGYGLIAAILIAILNHLKPTGGIFESFDKDRWHLLAKVHRYLAFSSFIGMVVGLLLITQDGLLFVEGHGPLEYIHGSMGVALVLAALFQVHIGYTYRKFYRTSLFMRDAHRWMGRILGAILVLWQLPSGALSLWGDAPVVAGLLWTVVPISLGTFLWYAHKRTSTSYVDVDSSLPPPHIDLEDTLAGMKDTDTETGMKDTDTGIGTGMKEALALEETSLSLSVSSSSGARVRRPAAPRSRSDSPTGSSSSSPTPPKHSRSSDTAEAETLAFA